MDGARTGDDTVSSVGQIAALLGVAPGTVRSWERRYGFQPHGRTTGGHRRYTAADIERLRRMQHLVDAGESPARAAAHALAGAADPAPAPERASTPGGPGGAVLAVPGASPQARGLARAASRLDGRAVGGLLGELLIAEGTVATWEGVLRPVLVAAGQRWASTGTGIDVEHVLSEATVEALRAHRALQAPARSGPPVLLACAPDDSHVLPLHVVAAALAERHVPTQVLGARVPAGVVAAVARRIGAPAVVVWRQLRSDAGHDLDTFAAARTRPLLLAGGPGWEGCVLPGEVRRPASLRDTVALLERSAPPPGR